MQREGGAPALTSFAGGTAASCAPPCGGVLQHAVSFALPLQGTGFVLSNSVFTSSLHNHQRTTGRHRQAHRARGGQQRARMTSFLTTLPAPAKEYSKPAPEGPTSTALAARAVKEPPPYGKRQAFVPRRLDDYGDGGRAAAGTHHDCWWPALALFPRACPVRNC